MNTISSHIELTNTFKYFSFPRLQTTQDCILHTSKDYDCTLAPIFPGRWRFKEPLPSLKQLNILNYDDYDNCSLTVSYDYLPSPSTSSHSGRNSPIHLYKANPACSNSLFRPIFPSPTVIKYSPQLNINLNKRTCINKEQKKVLDEYYRSNRYPSQVEKQKLSKLLSLKERTIQVWFQNRRQNRSKFKLLTYPY